MSRHGGRRGHGGVSGDGHRCRRERGSYGEAAYHRDSRLRVPGVSGLVLAGVLGGGDLGVSSATIMGASLSGAGGRPVLRAGAVW